MKIKNCRLCHGSLSEPKINLGETPLANEFLSVKTEQDKFPLEVCVCQDCGHYQLNQSIDPERLFRHYVYVAGTSPVNVEHFKKYAEHMVQTFRLQEGNKVLDIASNDGTLLKHFKNLGLTVLGIDPAKNLAEQATQEGIPTIPEFFTEQYADQILADHGQFNLITANNVFAHVPDLIGFAKGVKKLLANQGVFSFEVSYFADVCDFNLFDTIYHEHSSYHTIAPLKSFFKKFGLSIFDVEYIDNHGGSIRVFVTHLGQKPEYTNLVYEDNMPEKVEQLNDKITILKKNLNRLLTEYENVVIYGYPAKATTLMYALDIDPERIQFAVDSNPLKQNTFTPGLQLPVLSMNNLVKYKGHIDCLLILAWNFADSIMKKCREAGFDGKFVVPLPELKIYG